MKTRKSSMSCIDLRYDRSDQETSLHDQHVDVGAQLVTKTAHLGVEAEEQTNKQRVYRNLPRACVCV